MNEMTRYKGMNDVKCPSRLGRGQAFCTSSSYPLYLFLTEPITVLTGYLGAGKITLLDRILIEPYGKKAVSRSTVP